MTDFIAQFEELLEIEEGTMKPEDLFREYDGWDSLAILGLGAIINEEYDIAIPRNDFEKLIIVQDLLNYIENNK